MILAGSRLEIACSGADPLDEIAEVSALKSFTSFIAYLFPWKTT
jgi:hypothetical protein